MRFIIAIIFIVVLSHNVASASLLEKMADTKEISNFVEMMTKNKDELDSNFLTVFAPLNSAYDYSTLSGDKDKQRIFVQKHLTNWQNKPGLIENWNELDRFRSNSKYLKLPNYMKLYFYQRNDTAYVNTAVIDKASVMQHENKVGYIIKSVLGENEKFSNFFSYLSSESSLSTFNKMMTSVVGKSDGIPVTYFSSNIGTFLMPTNEAFKALPDKIMERIDNDMSYRRRMIYSQTVNMNSFGFFMDQTYHFEVKVPSGRNYSAKYMITNDKGKVEYETKTANVVTRNIILQDAIVHVVDKVLFDYSDIPYLMKTGYSQYYSMLTNISGIDFKEKDLTYLIPNSKLLNNISAMDNKTKNEIIGALILRNFDSNAEYSTGSTKSSMMYAYQGGWVSIYKDGSVRHTLKLGSKDDDIFSGNRVINIESSQFFVDTKSVMACNDLWDVIGRKSYKQLLSKLDINLVLGSPYTVVVPSESLLTNEVSKLEPKFQKYVLQRLILPINVTLNSLTPSRKYSVPTMNYATNNEYISVTKISTNNTKLEHGSMMGSMNNHRYFCYSDEKYKNDRSRYLSVYPVNFTLITDSDKAGSTKIHCTTGYCKKSGLQITNNVVLLIICVVLSKLIKE